MKNFRNRCLLGGLILLSASAWAQQPNFTLKGKLGTIDAPAMIELSYQLGDKTIKDSSFVKNGVYSLNGHLDGPTFAYLVLYHRGKNAPGVNSDVTPLILEPGNITMNSPDSLKKAVILGSKLNADQKLLTDALKPVRAKSDEFHRINGYLDASKPQSQTFVELYNREIDAFTAEEKAIKLQFIKTHPDSWVSLLALRDYGIPKNGTVPNAAVVEPLFKSLSERVRNTRQGRGYAAEIGRWKQVAIGSMAPDFTQLDTNDRRVSLSDFRGKYVLIDFWASWCHPCRDENPNLISQYKLYKDKNFVIVGITLDTPNEKATWLKAIREDGLPWLQLYDLNGYRKNEAVVNYGVQSIPENFLVDPSGKIVAKSLRGEALNATLKSILDK